MNLATFIDDLAAGGRVTFSRDEAMARIGVGDGAFLDAAERLQRQRRLFRPRRGFYVVVPQQFLSWGAPPPSWYIDDLMRHEGLPYYVGLLKAAELHGAAHQAVMEFQVVTHRQLKPISAGRSRIVFFTRKDLVPVLQAVEAQKTDSGRMEVASPELTAWDLLRYSHAVGGLDAAATVLSDLGPKLKPERLAALARAFELAHLQRLGYILERLGQSAAAAALAPLVYLAQPPWRELEPGEASEPDFSPPPLMRDPRWRVVVRRELEIDE